MPSSPTFEIRLMQKSDYESVFLLLQSSFFKDEPITRCIELTETADFAKSIIDDCLPDQCSFVAVDADTEEIVAVSLNNIMHKDQSVEIETTDEKIRLLSNVLVTVHQPRNVFEALQTDRLLHVYVVSVAQVARGQRLAARLIEKSVEYAKELHLPGAFAEATSLISMKAFKRQQFKVLNELVYAEYNPNRLAKLNTEVTDRCYLVARKF